MEALIFLIIALGICAAGIWLFVWLVRTARSKGRSWMWALLPGALSRCGQIMGDVAAGGSRGESEFLGLALGLLGSVVGILIVIGLSSKRELYLDDTIAPPLPEPRELLAARVQTATAPADPAQGIELTQEPPLPEAAQPARTDIREDPPSTSLTSTSGR